MAVKDKKEPNKYPNYKGGAPLFSIFGAGLLFLSHLFEFLAVVTFYALIGATGGYLVSRRK